MYFLCDMEFTAPRALTLFKETSCKLFINTLGGSAEERGHMVMKSNLNLSINDFCKKSTIYYD
jgi:hypothetical protein